MSSTVESQLIHRSSGYATLHSQFVSLKFCFDGLGKKPRKPPYPPGAWGED